MFNTLVVIKQPAARMKFMFQNSYVTLEHLVWLLFPYYVFRCPCVLSVIEVILKLSTLFNRTNNIHIWQRLCHEDWCTWSSRLLLSDHYNNAASQLYVRVKILLACEKHVHDHIILQTGGILAYVTLIPPPCIEVPVPSQESKPVMYLCVGGIVLESVFAIFYYILELFLKCAFFVFHWITRTFTMYFSNIKK